MDKFKCLILPGLVVFIIIAIVITLELPCQAAYKSGSGRLGAGEWPNPPALAGIRPEVTATSPANGETGVPLYRSVEVTLDREVASVELRVVKNQDRTPVPGKTSVNGTSVIFEPARVFMPGTAYTVILRAETAEHVKMEDRFSFTTVYMGQQLWVEVELGKRHFVTVYKGSSVIRRMPASGGLPQSPTPTGYFYTRDRGYSFWSPRFGEGATYWVRLAGQILIHSVPRDSRWRTKEEEHAKLGLPASHGCIRLSERDARWFFEHVPGGTLVIIHR